MMKRIAALLLTLAVALCAALPVFAAGTIEVTEDVSVSDAYDWTRFKGQNVTLNVYNWGEYISNGSDDSVDVVAAFEKLTGLPNRFAYRWQKALYRVFTLLCVLIGWVFFRASDLPAALAFLKSMLGLTENGFFDSMVIRTIQQYRFFFLAAVLCSTPLLKQLKDRLSAKSSRIAAGMEMLSVPIYFFLLLWAVSFIMIGSHNPFIYFNF